MLAVEWSQGIEDAWSDVAAFIPKLFGFLAILLIGYLVVKAISKIVDAALERVGFDNAVERGGIKKALAKSQYDASSIVSKIVFYALFLLVLQMAFGIFGDNPVSELITSVIAYLPKVLAAIVIIVVASAVGAALKTIVESTLGGLSYGKALSVVAGAIPVVFGVFAALDTLDVAPDIVRITFTALMALIVGSGIVAIGGAGIQPMRQYWERALSKIEEEGPRMKEQAAQQKTQMEGGMQQEAAAVGGTGEVSGATRRTTVQERVSGS